jgi:hypothetical protein
VVKRDGIPVTSIPRTLLDLATVVNERKLARAVDRAERMGVFDLTAVDHLLLSCQGPPRGWRTSPGDLGLGTLGDPQ